MPRSQPAPPAHQPAPVQRRAVIAAVTGSIAGIVGLVLLGVGAAAAASGPSPGPAAGPTPAVSVSSLPSADVETGMPPVLPAAAVTPPIDPSAEAVAVAQEGPVRTVLAPTGAEVASMSVLPRTGTTSGPVLAIAWILVVAGAALLAFRAVPRRPARLTRLRVIRRVAPDHDPSSR